MIELISCSYLSFVLLQLWVHSIVSYIKVLLGTLLSLDTQRLIDIASGSVAIQAVCFSILSHITDDNKINLTLGLDMEWEFTAGLNGEGSKKHCIDTHCTAYIKFSHQVHTEHTHLLTSRKQLLRSQDIGNASSS